MPQISPGIYSPLYAAELSGAQVPRIADAIANFQQAHLETYGQTIDRPWSYDADATRAGETIIQQYLGALNNYNALHGTALTSEVTNNDIHNLPIDAYAASLPSEHKASSGFFQSGIGKALLIGGGIALGAGALGAFADAGAAIGAEAVGADVAYDVGANLVNNAAVFGSGVTDAGALFSTVKNAASIASSASNVIKIFEPSSGLSRTIAPGAVIPAGWQLAPNQAPISSVAAPIYAATGSTMVPYQAGVTQPQTVTADAASAPSSILLAVLAALGLVITQMA